MLNKLFGFLRKNKQTIKIRLNACAIEGLDYSGNFMQCKKNSSVGLGYLKFNDFVKLTKLNPQIKVIDLSSTGKIFLNPDFQKIVKYAYEKKIALTANSGVDFYAVSEEILDTLVKYKFEYLTTSICGWDQISYETYHKVGNFNNVISNIKKLKELKNKYCSQLPFLTWELVVLESTDHFDGIKNAKELACELGCKFEFSKDLMGYHPNNISNGIGNEKFSFPGFNIPCSQLWLEPQINWDGRFMGCNVNHSYFFDNANLFEIPLAEYLQRPAVKNTKQLLMGKPCDGECNPYCKRMCHHYTVMKAEKHFITEKDLKSGKIMKVTI